MADPIVTCNCVGEILGKARLDLGNQLRKLGISYDVAAPVVHFKVVTTARGSKIAPPPRIEQHLAFNYCPFCGIKK